MIEIFIKNGRTKKVIREHCYLLRCNVKWEQILLRPLEEIVGRRNTIKVTDNLNIRIQEYLWGQNQDSALNFQFAVLREQNSFSAPLFSIVFFLDREKELEILCAQNSHTPHFYRINIVMWIIESLGILCLKGTLDILILN